MLYRLLCILLLCMQVMVAQNAKQKFDSLKQKGELVFAMHTLQRIPFFMKTAQGEYKGIDVELAHRIAETLGVKARFIYVDTPDAVVDVVASGKADLAVSGLALSLGRAKQVLYTKPYATSEKSLIFHRFVMHKLMGGDSLTVQEVVNLPGFVLAVEKDSAFVEFAKRLFPKAELAFYQPWSKTIVQDFFDGKVSALMVESLAIYGLLRAMPHAALRVLAVKLKGQEDDLYIITGKEKMWLRDYVNDFLMLEGKFYNPKEAMKDAKYQKVIQKVIDDLKDFWSIKHG